MTEFAGRTAVVTGGGSGKSSSLTRALGQARNVGNTHSPLSRKDERARESRWRLKVGASAARYAT